MKRVAALALGFLLSCVAGWGSGSSDDPLGPDPDPAAIDGHLQNPDGTFNEGNAQRVLNGHGSASELNVTGSGGTSTSSGSTTKESAGFACPDLEQGLETGTCACPDGGSFN